MEPENQSDARDRELGMDRSITRRDFLNGVMLGAGGLALSPSPVEAMLAEAQVFSPEKASGYYPPALTGLRGSHVGSFETAHALSQGGMNWDNAGAEADTGETYDLVVVGAGLSGLAAAYFFKKAAGPNAKVLILDNHDDFGGHAKRNEFMHGKRLMIGYGGTQSIDTPSSFSQEGKDLLREIGVDLPRFYTAFDQKLYSNMGLQRSVFFDKETFGEDRLVVGEGKLPWSQFLVKTPLADSTRKEISRLYEDKTDYLAGLSQEEKLERLRTISYRDYLLKIAKADPSVLPFFQARTHNRYARGIDVMTANMVISMGLPGFAGLGLGRPESRRDVDPYIFHFPEGSAGVARLIVRALIPQALPGSTMEDQVTARLSYAQLDDANHPVRLRLNSTVVRAKHNGDPASAKDVTVTYIRGDKPYRVKAQSVIMACYNAIIPHLCPEMPEGQRAGLKMAVKIPLVYSNVLIRNWTSFQKLGIETIHAPGGYHSNVSLDFPVSLGSYEFGKTPAEPMILHLVRAPTKPGLPARDQYRAGRAELLSTPFEEMERRTRDLLARALQSGGFDPARDIEGITINRWPHGYATGQSVLFDPNWSDEEKPWIVGRKQFGRISIANSDAAAMPLTQAAFDMGYRAVQEVLQTRRSSPTTQAATRS